MDGCRGPLRLSRARKRLPLARRKIAVYLDSIAARLLKDEAAANELNLSAYLRLLARGRVQAPRLWTPPTEAAKGGGP